MTIPFYNARRVVTNTGSVAFIDLNFRVEQASDVHVYAGEPGTVELVLGVDFTVSGVGTGTTRATLVNPANWGAYAKFAMVGEYTVSQPNDVDVGGPFGQRFEDALDRQTYMLQSFYDQVQRAVKMPITGPLDADNTLVPQPLQLIGWNADGTGLTSYPDVVQSIQGAIDAANRADAAASDAESAALDAASEASAAAAFAAANIAYDTKAAAQAATVPANATSLTLKGYSTIGDGRGGVFLPSNTGSADNFTTVDGRTWYRQTASKPRLFEFKAVGNGVVNDTAAVNAAAASGLTVDGEGLTYLVNSLPNDFSKFRNTAFLFNGIKYPTSDFLSLELSKITSTPFYADWVQDKAFVHQRKIIVPFQLAHGHTYDTTRIAWTVSHDDGNTYSVPEILIERHTNPLLGYNCFAAGVKDNRFVMVLEERVEATADVNALFMYDRVLDWSSRKTNGISLVAGSAIATIYEPKHGLMAGDKVSFSGVSGADITGLSAERTVASVIDSDRFTVNKGSVSGTTQNNIGGDGWYLAAAWSRNTWRITNMPLFPNNMGDPLTHVHSFVDLPGTGELFFGFHNGGRTGGSIRECGVIYVENFYGAPTFTKRRFPAAHETSSGEPCIRSKDGKLYATTRGTSASSNGSSLLVSSNKGVSWQGYRFPGTLHYSPLPFEFDDDGNIYIFGTERGENEWQSNQDFRYVQNRPRTFLLKGKVSEIEAGNFSNLVTTLLGYGMYEGEQVSSGAGVGSTLKTETDIWYFFGSEDWRVSTRYSNNLPSVDNEWIGQGYQPDIFAFRLRLKSRAGLNDFVLRAPDTRALGQYRDANSNNTKILAPLDIQQPVVRISGRLNMRVAGPIEVLNDAITLTPGYSTYYVDTEGGAATDNLTTINDASAVNGDIIALFSASSARDTTLVDNTGNLRLKANFTLLTSSDRVLLHYYNGNWHEVTSSTN